MMACMATQVFPHTSTLNVSLFGVKAEHILDSGLPLGFSVLIGSRFDCGAQFMATLILTEDLDNIATVTQSFVPASSRYHFHSTKLKTTAPAQWQRYSV